MDLDFTFYLMVSAVVTAYLLILIYKQVYRKKVDAGWILGFALFFEWFEFLLYQMDLGVSSLPFLVAVPAGTVIFACFNLKQRGLKVIYEPGWWLWAFFILYGMFSLLWTPNGENGQFKLLVLLIRGFIPGVYILWVYLAYRKFTLKPVLFIGCLYAITYLLFGQYTLEYPGRLVLPGGNPIWGARTLFMLASIALWHPRLSGWFRWTVLGLSIAPAVMTQSRGPLLAFVLSAFAVWIFSRRHRRLRLTMPYLLLGTAALSVLVLWGAYTMGSSGAGPFEDTRMEVLINPEKLLADSNFQERLALQQEALKMVWGNPFLGTGLGGSSPLGERTYPHNLPLEILSEMGLIGFSLWLVALGVSFRAARGNPLLQSLLLQSFSYGLFSGDLGFNYEYILFSMLALALKIGKGDKDYAHSFSHYRTHIRWGGYPIGSLGYRVKR